MIILFPPGKSFQWVALMLVGLLLGLMGCKPPAGDVKSMAAKPNFVLIVIDDLGYGDLGSYGSKLHKTPHIDQLAEEGIRFTDFHTNGPVCSPTRAALMTGQYQQRSGIESAIGFVKDEGVPLSKVTIAEILSEHGYACGVVGKWHLGHVDNFGPNDQGFGLSYCSNNSPDYHSHVSRNGEVDWYKDHELHPEPGYITDLVTRHSNEFIEAHKEEPFFLFVSHPAVHFPFQGPTDPPFRKEGKLWHGNERVTGQVQPDSKYGPLPPENYKRAYKDMLESVDSSVGAIVEKIDELGLRERTLIVVTSDNGAYSWVGSNGIYRGQKGDLFEGGHRVPGIFNWPGKIPKGSVSEEITTTMDLAPTFVSLAGTPDSEKQAFDGIDISPVLFDQVSLPPRTIFWRFNNSYTDSHARAVREGNWKYVVEEGETYLFNLSGDPGEQVNLALANPNLVGQMEKAYLSWEQDVTNGTPAN
ncbi:MAG: sulfatase [Verrucomicrobia bacterium]|nr:sulfatase [Verrucomicrobiota bacterium]MDA1067433.1 sulfatase [Verrucomicrobiota bacterium]